MTPRLILLVGSFFILSRCTPSADTGDRRVNELVDKVVGKVAPFHQCLEIGGRTSVVEYPADYAGPALGLQPDSFDDEEMKSAARAVAVSLDDALRSEISAAVRVIGEPDAVDGSVSCALKVGYPLFSRDYAFVEFSAPSGTIGAYAFKRSLWGWRTVERFHFGYW